MNLASRCRELLASMRVSKRAAVALVVGAAFVFAAGAAPLYAQTGGAATAAGAAAAASTARAPEVAVSGESHLANVWNNSSSVNCSISGGVGSCILQVVGFVVTFIFSLISYFLSKLLLVLTSVLITFARYNKFNNAPPVQIGWVIVRDIANMFFIVVVLVSAFMTIIGKAEEYQFHYSKVIPKLLFAAVMVNFSKTIVLLLIDFSQVVTLTFVSAFEGSIAGNLIQGLGITQMVRLQDSRNMGAGGTDVAVNLVNICLAYLLSIFLLLTAVATVLIYVGYFIVRIIALWMLIIFSPAAFLAGGVPSSVGKMLGPIASGFWEKLGKLLSGGPIIAFCLWLTFATIQQTASSGGVATANIGFDFPENSTLGFITQIGTAPQLAGFIVGVAMLMIGFQAATSAANDVGMGMPALASKIKGYRDMAWKKLSRAPVSAARLGGRGVRGGFNILDKRNNWSGKLGSGIAMGRGGLTAESGFLNKVGANLGSAARYVPGYGAALASGAAGALATRRSGLIGEDRKKLDERMGKLDNLPPEERVAALRGMRRNELDDLVGGQALLEKQHEELSKDENRKTALKMIKAEEQKKLEEKELEARRGAALRADPAADVSGIKLSDDEKSEMGRRASAVATRKLRDEEGARVKKLKEYADTAKDGVKLAAIKKDNDKNMRYDDDKDYDKRIAQLNDPTDESAQLKDVDPSLMKDGKFALALMRQAGATDADAKTIDPVLMTALRDMHKDNKELMKTFDLVEKQIKGGGSTKGQIESTVRQKDGYGVERLHSNVGDGGALYSAQEKSAIKSLGDVGSIAIKQAMFDAELPIEQIKAIIDARDGAGATIAQLADEVRKATDGAVRDPRSAKRAVEQVSELLAAADQVGGSAAETANIVKQAIGTKEKAEALFGQYGSFSYERQKQAQGIIRQSVKVEKSDADVEKGMAYIRSSVFPETKTPVEIGTKIQEFEDTRQVMKDGKPVYETTKAGDIIYEDKEKKIPKIKMETFKNTRVVPNVVERIAPRAMSQALNPGA